jgi:lysozyme family protein
MSSKNFSFCLTKVLVHEGGFSDDPLDPGGATNKGVTQAVYDSWRHLQGMSQRSVQYITNEEMSGIYKMLYWDRARCDDLPNGVDYAVFDFAVNSGVNRAITFLQVTVDAVADGLIGKNTIMSVSLRDPAYVINALCDKRLAFLKRLTTFKRFGKGWTRRVTEVCAAAEKMV